MCETSETLDFLGGEVIRAKRVLKTRIMYGEAAKFSRRGEVIVTKALKSKA